MLWFFFCVAILVLGYFIYGKIIEKIFVINPKRQTPAYQVNDGVDYMPMSKTKIWLIQLLNIAGTGPIFGPILGALYGPVAMLWIVLGCIFAGAVHDYFCGMLSIRHGGATMPYLAGKFLGKPVKLFINALALILLLLVGVVFVASPAQLMGTITMDVFGASQGALQLGDAEAVHQAVEAGGLKFGAWIKQQLFHFGHLSSLLTIFSQHYFRLIKSLAVSIHYSERYCSLCL
ncbi:carbon starvation protein, membrane protein [Haemophilus parahaemolyticus]|uniref:Carbon starvation protein, membrane protein n=1 Tax=Haemophilus parahaemolyticus TaxID=735 RepID=A0A377HY99_HAEPH|nr:carbon starvation protein, membrane protein [Haemophilus parahaemolyticus]